MCSAKCGMMGEASSAAMPIQYRTRSACIPMSTVTSWYRSQTDCSSLKPYFMASLECPV